MEYRGQSRKSWTKTLAMNLIIILVSIGFALCVAEIVLRTFPSLIGVPVLERFNSNLRQTVADRLQLSTKSSRSVIPSSARSDRGPDFYSFAPNRTLNVPVDQADAALGAIVDVVLDRKGFCNPAAAAERDSVEFLLLGDSMTFCTAVKPEDTSSAQLERISGVSAYNLGIPGIGPFEYVELLRKFGLAMKPRFVIMNVYEGNDLRDSDRYHNFLLRGEQARDPDALGGPFAWSYALGFIKAAIELQVRQVDRNTGIDFRYEIITPAGNVSMNIANNDRDEVRYAKRLENGDISPDIMEAAFDSFRELARENEFVPVIAFIPSAYSTYAQGIVFNEPGLEMTLHAGGEIQRRWFREYAARTGLLFLDLKTAFQEAAQKSSLTYFPANVHLTPEGQRIVATELATALRP